MRRRATRYADGDAEHLLLGRRLQAGDELTGQLIERQGVGG